MFIKKYLLILCSILILTIQNIASASTLLVMGDSLSAAYNLPQQDGWVNLLEKQLSITHPTVKVINASISGETTQGGLSRFASLLTTQQPSWVIIELGANDALRGYPLNQTTLNIEKMVDQAQDAGAIVLLLGNQIPQNYGKRYTQMFYNLYKKVADQYQLLYMPFMLKDVATSTNLMLSDGLHPNKEGQTVVLKNIQPYIEKLLGSNKE
ncbi:arylesterase [Marinomonas sp.]|nr:arylesterase [Marinomonas sp.]MDB4837076.1 arylesterase [Marinomonas sp.]